MRGSFRFQLILLFILVGILPLIAVSSLSYFVYYNNIVNMTSDTASYNVDWVANNINRYFQNVEKVSTIGDTMSVNRFLREPEATPNASWEILTNFELYRNSIFDEDSIHDITIIGLNGKCQSERTGFYRIETDVLNRDPLIATILTSDFEETVLAPNYDVLFRKNNTNPRTIMLGAIIRDTTTLEVLGVIIIDIYPEKIRDYYLEVKGDIIGQMELEYEPENLEEHAENSPINMRALRKGLLFFREISYEGWFLSYKISYNEFIEPIRGILQLTFVILFFSIIIIIFIFFFISRKIIAPLTMLRTRMEDAAQGDFSARLDVATKDKVINTLGSSFNKMVYDLESLMKQKEEEHSNYLHAHFRMLQQQINPHFLYNTLDAIIWMTLERRNEEVVNIVESLSTFFRLNLSRGEVIIPVSDAILSIENYLSIQKIRYADSLEYKIDINKNALQGKILKLIFQPIIENAIYHGIKEKGSGLIIFNGSRDGDSLIFTIHDNGAGIAKEQLKQLKSSLKNPVLEEEHKAGSKGFGLRNVQSRIRLYYGEQYGLTVNGEEGKGFSVIIHIPWMP